MGPWGDVVRTRVAWVCPDEMGFIEAHVLTTRRLISKAKHELEAVLLGIWVPVRPIPIPCIVRFVFNLPGRDPKRDGLVWLCGDLRYMG